MNKSQLEGGRVEPDAVIEANFADQVSAQMVALLVAQLRQRIAADAKRIEELEEALAYWKMVARIAAELHNKELLREMDAHDSARRAARAWKASAIRWRLYAGPDRRKAATETNIIMKKLTKVKP